MGLVDHILRPPVARPAWLRILALSAGVAGALTLRFALDPWLGRQHPFALLLPAVLFVAWYGGVRAGLIATVVTAVAAVQLFLRPEGYVIRDAGDAIAFLLFLAEGALFCVLCAGVHHAVNRARASADEALRKFQTMANRAPVLIWASDAAGRCTFVNQQWCLFTGRTSAEELGSGWLTQVAADDRAVYLRTFTAALAEQSPYQLEYRRRRADGTSRWLLEHAIPRYSTDGRFAGYIGSCIDITRLRRERTDLDFIGRLQRDLGASLDLQRIAAALARAVVPQLADCFCLELVHPDGRRELVHADPLPSIARELANSPGSAAVVGTGEIQFTARVDSAPAGPVVPDPASQEKMQRLGLVSHLAAPLLARGGLIGVLTIATTDSHRILDADDVALVRKIAATAGLALDNARLHQRTVRALATAERTRRRLVESESELGRQQSLLNSVIAAVPALVAYVGPDGGVRLHNENYREWLGAPDPAAAGSWPFGTDRAQAAAHLRAALAGENVDYEDCLESPARRRQVAVTLRPDRDVHGRVRGVVVHAYDITERNQAYAELATARELLRCHADELEARVRQRTATLRETNAELEAFTYSVSHDLRTPLQFISSFAAALREDPASRLSDGSRNHLDQILRAAARMQMIIHDLLDYSRLGRADLVVRPLSLDQAVAEVIGQHQVTIRRQGAQVFVESPLPSVLADQVGLFQILSNLIANALKFTVPGRAPVVHVHAESAAGFVRLWIDDNGLGIHARHHEKIFQLFERLHSAAEYPGTGIGLALVRKAAERMGGRCGVESAAAGSRFWIDFRPGPPVVAPGAPAFRSDPGVGRLHREIATGLPPDAELVRGPDGGSVGVQL